MSFGYDFLNLFYRAAQYVDRIIKGAVPADLPIQQPTKFQFVLNLATARLLGLSAGRSWRPTLPRAGWPIMATYRRFSPVHHHGSNRGWTGRTAEMAQAHCRAVNPHRVRGTYDLLGYNSVMRSFLPPIGSYSYDGTGYTSPQTVTHNGNRC
jgi:hypothetical protein